MELYQYTEKLNKVDGVVYVWEEEAAVKDGVYEGELQHDNINPVTLSVHTGSKLTGEKLETYAVSTPSLTPWKRTIRIYSSEPSVYITYETEGDTVEAVDINQLQVGVMDTQKALNAEADRAGEAERVLSERLQEETERAKAKEKLLSENLDAETARAKMAENVLTDNLTGEIGRATGKETELEEDIQTEAGRAKQAENVLTQEVSSEITRAKAAEKTVSDRLTTETSRAVAKETELQENINTHTTAVNGEIQALKASDTTLDEKKANTTDVNKEFGNRYTKDQVYTKSEVLQKIEDLIGTAPDALDTLREIADSLGNDPNFAATMVGALAGKVDKESGKQLTSNDYSASEKALAADVNAKKHTHSNKTVLDKVTQGLLDHWNVSYTHVSNKANPHGVTAALVGLGNAENKNGVTIRSEMTKAEVVAALGYTPPTASPGYTHPSSGVTAGTYRNVTVNAQGHVTTGSNPTTLVGYGITDAAAKTHNHDAAYMKKGPVTWNNLKGV